MREGEREGGRKGGRDGASEGGSEGASRASRTRSGEIDIAPRCAQARWTTRASAGVATPCSPARAMAALAAQSPEQLQKMGVRRKDIDNILQAAAVAAWQEQQEKQATVPPAAEPKAETEPMTEAVDISSMSVKELKAYITRKGLSHADCCEKSELQARARSAQVTINDMDP